MRETMWFFAWSRGTPYITTICAWDARSARQEALKVQGDATWKRLYDRGGRIIKCTVRQVKP